MKESKLQKKTIRLVLQIYLGVFMLSLGLCWFFVVRPLKESAIDSYIDQNNYILDEVDSQLNTIKEYTNYIAYSQYFMEVLNEYLKSPEDALAQYDLESCLYSMRNLKQGVQSIVLEVPGYKLRSSILELKEEELELMNSQWYQRIQKSNYSDSFSRGLLVKYPGEEVRSIAYSKSYHIKNKKFTLTVFFRYDDLLGNLTRYYHKVFEEQYWMTLEGQAYFADDQSALDALFEKFDREGDRVQSNGNGVLIRSELQNISSSSVAYIPMGDIYNEIGKNTAIILMMAVFLLIGTLLAAIYVVRCVTRPVYQLSKAMNQIVAENFATKLPVESDDEIGELSSTFNDMSEKIQEYFQRLVEQMEAEQEMKFGLLISQIDPHFVCNTLNTIKYLAIQGRTKDVEVVSSALSSILRDRLRVKNFRIYDTVWQEAETVKQYLTIQQYRYGGEVQVLWEIDEEALACRIPKNMIQPLVENALFYGLSDEEDGSVRGTIKIQIQKKDAVYIRVMDNGNGMEEAQIEELLKDPQEKTASSEGHGIGIDNIRERLRILYGGAAKFHIRSKAGEWTEVEIIIYDRSKEEEKCEA